MKKKLILIMIMLGNIYMYAQEKPKLVVGIVVDQMRYDYIYRFWDDFGNYGFKKLIKEGYFCRNTNYSYMPTFTGPGHASIFTGTTPSIHGIIANNWFDKNSKEFIYCAGDGDMHTVCNCDNQTQDVVSSEGKMSPHHMLTSTIGDEMQLFNAESKVIGISLKDRGAILAAGHSADAAYWMDKNGDWISSSFYMSDLPDWLVKYQQKNNALNYLQGKWTLKDYFAYNLDSLFLAKGGQAIKSTPLGNTILKDLAVEIIKQEKIGQQKETDLLTISFSSTDYIGHQYGPHSKEIEDTYLKLDKDIADLLKVIDTKIGFENVLLFITADHGVVSEPSELIKRRIPGGYFNKVECKTGLHNYLTQKFGEGNWILSFSNMQFFLNEDLIETKNLNIKEIREIAASYLIKLKGVKNVYTAHQIHNNEYTDSYATLIQNGYNQKISGDVVITLQSGWLDTGWEDGGTSHGSSFSYDTHVPLIFWGGIIPKGRSDRQIYIRDIAPTVSILLGTSFPNGCTGNPIVEITE